MALYKGKIPIISRSLNEGFLRGANPDIAFGCEPRDFSVDPVEMRDSPNAMTLVNESDDDAMWEADEENQSSLEHLFLRNGQPAFENLDQNGDGDCWAYSTAQAMMVDCLKQGLPIPILNPHGVAAMLKRYNGGWCGLSMKFVRENGCPLLGTGPGQWPLHSHDNRYDTPECREQMKLHKATEDWYDLGRAEWDQKLSVRQWATCSFNNIPCPRDYNRASHSMLGVRRVRYGRNEWGDLILNSWKGFGFYGLAVLDASWNADNSCALRSSTSTWR